MFVETTSTTAAPPDRVWTALADVRSLPRWTPSIRSVEPLAGPELEVGARFRVKQPGLPLLVWTVTEVEPGRSFTWATSSPGVRTVGAHRLAPGADGGTDVVLSINQTGPAAALVALLTGRRTRRYLRLEADGLAAAGTAMA